MAIFQRSRFRRSGGGPMQFFNMALAAGVGVISANYIFREPLEEYWKEQRMEEGRNGSEGGGSGSDQQQSSGGKVSVAATKASE